MSDRSLHGARLAGRFNLSRLGDAINEARALYRQRRELEMLDDHLLRDLGLTREEARQEAARPVWDAPHHWRC